MGEKIQIEKIRDNENLRSAFIEKYTGFILASSSKVLKRYVRKEDDEFSIAVLGFNEAITKYEESRGEFFEFASLIIKNRLIDYCRKEMQNPIPFSYLAKENDEGDIEEFEAVGQSDVVTDIALELQSFKEEIEKYGLSLFDLSKHSPKSYKTKSAVYDILMFIISSDEAKMMVLKKCEIPVKLICNHFDFKPKILERHRKYIIAATIILAGEYPIISDYIHNLKGVAK